MQAQAQFRGGNPGALAADTPASGATSAQRTSRSRSQNAGLVGVDAHLQAAASYLSAVREIV